MFGQQDDLFACGAREPHSSTVCSVVGVDDLIIVGIIAAASIAASQISASENESASNDMTKQREQFAMRQQAINFQRNRQDRAAAENASLPGMRGWRSRSEELQPWADKLAIQNGADLERAAAARQADATRTQGYISAGSALAQGIAGQALRPAAGSGFTAGGYYDGTGMGIADRAGAYDLNANTSQLLANGPAVATPAIRSAVDRGQIDLAAPGGGFQLEQSDYDLLNGGGLYSQAGGYDPARRNRYGFTL